MGEGDRGWEGWMGSPTQWRWVWVNSGSWWWTGRPGVLQSVGARRVGHDWATELYWWKLNSYPWHSTASTIWSQPTCSALKNYRGPLREGRSRSETAGEPAVLTSSPCDSPLQPRLRTARLEWVFSNSPDSSIHSLWPAFISCPKYILLKRWYKVSTIYPKQ